MAEFYDKSYLIPQQQQGGFKGLGVQKGFFGNKRLQLLAAGYKSSGEQTAFGKATGWLPGMGIPMQFAAERATRGTDVQKPIKENRAKTFAKTAAYYKFGADTAIKKLSGGTAEIPDTGGATTGTTGQIGATGSMQQMQNFINTPSAKPFAGQQQQSNIVSGINNKTFPDYINQSIVGAQKISDGQMRFDSSQYTGLSQYYSGGIRPMQGTAKLGYGKY
jgi:hypothetical protein